MAILFAVEKWRHYLENAHFIIKTDHESIEHLLQQRITIYVQKKGLTKLLGLDYSILYRIGSENSVTDALSRRESVDESKGSYASITLVVMPLWM